MAEKKSVVGAIMAVGVAAAAGVAAYVKREELKKAADDIMKKVKKGEADDVCAFDSNEDGEIDVVIADSDGNDNFDTMIIDTDGDGCADEVAVDLDGDGEMDVVTPLTCEESDFAE